MGRLPVQGTASPNLRCRCTRAACPQSRRTIAAGPCCRRSCSCMSPQLLGGQADTSQSPLPDPASAGNRASSSINTHRLTDYSGDLGKPQHPRLISGLYAYTMAHMSHTHKYTNTHTYMCTYMSMHNIHTQYAHRNPHMYVHTYAPHTCTLIHTHIYILAHVCVHTCMYTIHVYTYTVKLKSSLQFQHLFKYPEITMINF